MACARQPCSAANAGRRARGRGRSRRPAGSPGGSRRRERSRRRCCRSRRCRCQGVSWMERLRHRPWSPWAGPRPGATPMAYRPRMQDRPDRAPALHASAGSRRTTCPARSRRWRRPAIDPSRSPGCPRRPRRAGRACSTMPGLSAIASHQVDRGACGATGRPSPIAWPRSAARALIVPWLPEEDRQTADGVRRFAAELAGFAGHRRRSRDPARLPQPRVRVRAARGHDGLGRPARRARHPRSSSSSTSTGRPSAAATRWPRSRPTPIASASST